MAAGGPPRYGKSARLCLHWLCTRPTHPPPCPGGRRGARRLLEAPSTTTGAAAGQHRRAGGRQHTRIVSARRQCGSNYARAAYTMDGHAAALLLPLPLTLRRSSAVSGAAAAGGGEPCGLEPAPAPAAAAAAAKEPAPGAAARPQAGSSRCCSAGSADARASCSFWLGLRARLPASWPLAASSPSSGGCSSGDGEKSCDAASGSTPMPSVATCCGQSCWACMLCSRCCPACPACPA